MTNAVYKGISLTDTWYPRDSPSWISEMHGDDDE